MIRKHVVFKGKVQGVFFRNNTREKASEEDVTGWVKNLKDGSVEAIFEGDKEKVEEVIRWCREEQPHARVTSLEIQEEEATGEFRDFSIKR